MNHNPSPLINLNRKAIERRTLQLLAQHTAPEPKAINKDVANLHLRSKTPIVRRTRHPHEALPPTADLFNRPVYVVGMGDHFHAPDRPGSDHSHLKSFGTLT